MKVRDLIAMLKGKEDWDLLFNMKFMGRSVTASDGDIIIDELEPYKKAYITIETKTLNNGFEFDDGKGTSWKRGELKVK